MLILLLRKAGLVICTLAVFTMASGQVVRPFGSVYSQNLKGGTAIFGNTSMNILNGSVPDLTKMNDSGNPSNGAGGIGYSNYGNDNENMQPVMTDAINPGTAIFSQGSAWKYNNPNSDQGTSWRMLLFPPAATWKTGTGSFGYGLSQTVTIPAGNNTNYFLKSVNIVSASAFTTYNFTLSYNDGAVVYVNGVEVKRLNMPAGTVSYSTAALVAGTTMNQSFSVPASAFHSGINVIAVEIHQVVASSVDCFFDLSVTGMPYNPSNATSADLVLPAGTNTIKFARLYWGGRVDNATINAGTDTLRKIKIRKGTSGLYTDKFAPAGATDQTAISGTETLYQTYVDITDFIQANGAGTYTVADVPCTGGAVAGGGHFAGWCIVLAYENPAQPYNSIRIYDGYVKVFNSGTPFTQQVTLSGLNLPNNPLTLNEAIMSTMVWEGDASLGASAANPAGDYIKINGIAVSNGVNPVGNFWNGTVSRNGAFVTTKNPNYTNQMGIDIDEIPVGTGYNIMPNATSVNFEFGTEADQYFPSVFAFSVRMKDPLVTLNKTVADASGNNELESNEILTYTLTGTNTGIGTAYGTYITDNLPSNTTYVPNSLKINAAPGISTPTGMTDAEGDDLAFKAVAGTTEYVQFHIGVGATPFAGGQMDPGNSYSVSFKAKGPMIPASVSNTARVTAFSQAGDAFSDDGTAVISPSAAPVPVKLIDFTVSLQNDKLALLKWTTENELNNHHFEAERSEDGIHFIHLGNVAGNGTTALTHHYQYGDHLNTSAAIVYYRLKSVDLDGQFSYSKIIALRLKATTGNDLLVYPNPFTDNLKVALKVNEDINAGFRIFSFDGKEVLNRKILLQRGENIVVLKDLQFIAKGNYMLEVNTGSTKLVQKVIKN